MGRIVQAKYMNSSPPRFSPYFLINPLLVSQSPTLESIAHEQPEFPCLHLGHPVKLEFNAMNKEIRMLKAIIYRKQSYFTQKWCF